MIAMLALLLATITAPYTPVSYACDGSTAAFTVSFPYQSSANVSATSTTAGGAVTSLALTTDFTLSVSSTQSTAVLTILVPATKCPSGSTLRIARSTDVTQPTGFRSQTTYRPDRHETAYDRAIMIMQETPAIGGPNTWVATQTFAPLGASSATAIVAVGGLPSGVAVVATGQGASDGVTGTGGGTSGIGIHGVGGAPNGDGLKGNGVGSGHGVRGIAGPTGNGLEAFGGVTSGSGVNANGGASSGNGVVGTGGTPNGRGVDGQGTGTGPGVRGTGGSTGAAGGTFTGTSGNPGLTGQGQGAGAGGLFTGGATGGGIVANAGATSGAGGTFTGTGTGSGVNANGGGTSGAGVGGTGGSPNGGGIVGLGTGSGPGLSGTGGATGAGVNGQGGATSGNGANFTATNGNGAQGTGGSGGAGLSGNGQGAGTGVSGTGGATGPGGIFGGGATSGDGVQGSAAAGNGRGVTGVGNGTGVGGDFVGGATGAGARAAAGGGGSPASGALNLVPQAAPSAPGNGDTWVETTSNTFKSRINGTTQTVFPVTITSIFHTEVAAGSGSCLVGGADNASTTITTAGTYLVTAQADLISGVGGSATVCLRKNAANLTAGCSACIDNNATASAGSNCPWAGQQVVSFAASDTIKLRCTNVSGGSIQAHSLSAIRLGP